MCLRKTVPVVVGVRLSLKPIMRDLTEYHSIHDDHQQHGPQYLPVLQHKVQSRVQHHALTRHHHDPAGDVDDDANIVGRQYEELKEEAYVIWEEAEGGDEEGVEVQARIATEGCEDQGEELDRVVEGEGRAEDHDELPGVVGATRWLKKRLTCHGCCMWVGYWTRCSEGDDGRGVLMVVPSAAQLQIDVAGGLCVSVNW